MSRTSPPPYATSGRHRSPAAPVRRGGWRGFVDRYGWRAYALPILTVATIGALVHGSSGTAPQPRAAGRHASPAAPAVAGAPHRPVGDHNPVAPARTEAAAGSEAGFRAAATPARNVIPLKTDNASSCASNSYRQLILVSIHLQHLWVCHGAKQINETPVTTGSVVHHDRTPLGSWRVQGKQRDRYLVGPGYRDYVHFWVPFNGDFGLHDAPWQTMPFGSSGWRTNGSHGCVHVPSATMAWIYRWAHVGGTVVTIER